MRCICILMFTYVDSVNMSLSKLREMVKDRGAWRAAVHGITKSRTRLSDQTTMFIYVHSLDLNCGNPILSLWHVNA